MPLELRIGDEAIRLAPEPAEVQRVVACAYLVGGYAVVVALVEQVQARIRALRYSLKLSQSLVDKGAAEFVAGRGHAALADWAGAQASGSRRQSDQREQLKEAEALAVLMRRSWATVAEAEEEALAQYERMALDEFISLARKAQAVVRQQWARHAPCDPAAQATQPLDEAAARRCGADKLRLAGHRDGLLAAIFQLKRAATEYAAYLGGARQAADTGYTRRNAPTKDVWKTLADAQDAAARSWTRFEELRERLGREYPMALQVYGELKDRWNWDARVPDAERDRTIETWVIQAMLDTLEQAPEVIAEAERLRVFKDGAVVRRQPQAGVFTGVGSGLDSRGEAAGLVLPASRVVVGHLQNAQVALKSAWLQRPVRLRLRARATGLHQEAGLCAPPEAALAPYFQHGRLHHAALAEVEEGVSDEREAAEQQKRRVLMVMDAVALPAAFFTGGWSAILAGAVHAAVRAQEMGVQIQSYFAASALAGLSFSTVEDCMWKPPSTVQLAATLLEGGFDIGSGLVVGGRAGAALDAVQTVLTLSHGAAAVNRWIEGGAKVEA
ncbi:MAG: hypothetical protein ACOZJX_03865 [Pseudomonadota bacterium]